MPQGENTTETWEGTLARRSQALDEITGGCTKVLSYRDQRFSVPSGDGRNPSPSGEAKFVDVPEGDETPPTEVGG